jgi:hypothetical protein
MTQPMRYADVVWYRKSGIQTFFVLLALQCIAIVARFVR